MSLPEVVLWQLLRGGRLGALRFRRQHPIGPYILDFYCPAVRLAVELDGTAHDHPERAKRDRRRDAWLAARDIAVLRVRAQDVLEDERLDGLLDAIQDSAASRRVD